MAVAQWVQREEGESGWHGGCLGEKRGGRGGLGSTRSLTPLEMALLSKMQMLEKSSDTL